MSTQKRYLQRRSEPGADELCTCGHRYAIHAGLPESACVRYEAGRRCGCRSFVKAQVVSHLDHGKPEIVNPDGTCAICGEDASSPAKPGSQPAARESRTSLREEIRSIPGPLSPDELEGLVTKALAVGRSATDYEDSTPANECDGSASCEAQTHLHGCFADRPLGQASSPAKSLENEA